MGVDAAGNILGFHPGGAAMPGGEDEYDECGSAMRRMGGMGEGMAGADGCGTGGPVLFHCVLCGVQCNSATTLEQHLVSKKHMAKAAR